MNKLGSLKIVRVSNEVAGVQLIHQTELVVQALDDALAVGRRQRAAGQLAYIFKANGLEQLWLVASKCLRLTSLNRKLLEFGFHLLPGNTNLLLDVGFGLNF